MRAVFLMLKVEPNRLAEVADQVSELDTFSEAYSISGAYDLLVKLYVEDFDDLSSLVTEQIHKDTQCERDLHYSHFSCI